MRKSLNLSSVLSLVVAFAAAVIGAALFLIPSGFMFTVFEFFTSPFALIMGAGVALTVGTSKFFKPKIKAFVESVTHRTIDRYAIRSV